MRNITNNNAFLMAMGEGSRIEIHAAAAEKDSWTQLAEEASAGETTLRLTESTGWQVGDRIAIAATGYDMDEAEERTIAAVSDDGRIITLDQPLQYDHAGEVQTHDNGKTGAGFRSWDLDMRAEVALLSRNVTIQGDADSKADGYGGHTMVMDGAAMHIDGAELTRMGQDGAVGRYPLHWHLMGDVSGQYITNSSIHDSFNKGITIHGTQFAWLEDNVVYDTVGHSYYFEDGSEFGNVLTGNLGMNTNAAVSVAAAAIGSDHTAVSTYWVTNPDNHLIDNTAAGSDEVGFWFLSQEEVEGQSAVLGLYDGYEPRDQIAGQWVGNTSHSNGADGIFIGGQFDESNGSRNDPAMKQIFTLTDFTTYKNVEVAVWVRNSDGNLTDIKSSDSQKGAQIWGTSIVTDSLFIGSLEDNPERPQGEYHGWELYDQASHFSNVHFDGYSGPNDAAIAQGHGWGKSSNNSAEGLTFGDDVPDDRIFQTKNAYSDWTGGRFNGDGTIAGTLLDIDGSITGTPGALVTPAIIPVDFNDKVDILNKAFDGIAASGFNASPGAVYLPEQVAWINPAGSVIGKVEYRNSGNQADRDPFTIERTDNGAKILYGNDAQGESARGQFNVDGSGDVEYIITYPEALPDEIDMKFKDLPEGASAIYRFKGLPADAVIQGADQVPSVAGLMTASATAWTRDGDDFVLRIYADRFVGQETSRSDEDSVSAESFQDEFRIIIADRATANPSGNQNPIPAPEDFWGTVQTTVMPERAASTSETAVISGNDAHWSDAGSWSDGVPTASDIVVIGPNQRIVLDTDVSVKGIIVNGGELLVKDARDLALQSDWVLVISGGLFQVGTEDAPFQHDFELTLEGDDPGNDVDVAAILDGAVANVVRAVDAEPGSSPQPAPDPEPTPNPEPAPNPEPEPKPDPTPAPDPEPAPNPEPEPKPDPNPAPEPEPKPAPNPEPQPEPKDPTMQTTVFTAINSQSDEQVADNLANGVELTGDSLSIVADPGISVGSASFYLNGSLVRTENVAPYALFGDSSGDYFEGNLPSGNHTLEVVFYSGSGGSGEVLLSDTLNFSVTAVAPDTPVEEPATPDPVDPPVGDGGPAAGSLVAWADQVVFHFDGNNNDEDDIAAIPVAALLAASSGIADKTTFLYGNNLTENTNSAQLVQLEESAAFAETLGVSTMGYQPDPTPTTAQLVDMLQSGQKVLMIEGGPMEAVYRALDQVDPALHSNIQLLSHSTWNETRGQNGGRTWADIAEDFPGVTRIDIRDQNWGQNNDQGFYNNAWDQFDGSDDPILSAARDAMNGATFRGNATKNNDASDAGMLWYALTGQENGTGQEAVAYIESSGLLDGDPGDTPVDPVVDVPENALFTLALDHQSPLSEATYDAETGQLDLVFDYGRLLDVNGEWSNGRHIDALTIGGDVYPLVIHADDGPRDASGNYIFDQTTVENTFSFNIGAGRSAADGTLDFGLTDNENGTNELYSFEMVSDSVPPVEEPIGPFADLIMAVNAGGDTFQAANGLVYEADTFDNGNSYSTSAAISGTENDGLYQTERWQQGGFTYEIAVENGTYDLELNFAEIWAGASNAGQRVFDLMVEDQLIFDGLDIVAEVGFNAALDLIGEVEVTDGALTIETLAGVQNPKLSGFSIWESSGDLDTSFSIGALTDDLVLA